MDGFVDGFDYDDFVAAFEAGWSFGETTESFSVQYEVAPANMKPGVYRNISGNTATAWGAIAAAQKAGSDDDTFLRKQVEAKVPTIAAMAYKYSIGQPFVYPQNRLDYSPNFLHMCFAVPCEEYVVQPALVQPLDQVAANETGRAGDHHPHANNSS